MKIRNLLSFVFVLLLLGIPSVMATTLLNITLTEVFHRNVTFAQNFELDEATPYRRIYGEINVSNPFPNVDTIYDIYVILSNTEGLIGDITWIAGRNGTQFNSSSPGEFYYLHIPELRANDSTLFNYSMNGSIVNEPLNLSTDYGSNTFTKKVLAGENFTIKQNVRNQDFGQNMITDVNITIFTQGINWTNGTESFLFNFSLSSLNQSDDWTNVTQFSNSTWSWVPNGGNLLFNITYNITYNISPPFQTPDTATYLALLETLEYRIASTSSNLTVHNVTGGARVNFSETKRIIRPSNNLQDTNVTWESSAAVGTPLNISFQLTRVTMWVTSTLNPNIYANDSTSGLRLLRNFTPDTEINLTASWSTGSSPWIFNFSDGTGGTPPPIVWMKPEYTILYKNQQILNYSVTTNGTDVYLKYIYVVSGYWLEVFKNVTNWGADNYTIEILVRNRGNQPTPQNLTVTVYDFVPSGFINGTMSPLPNSYQAVQSSTESGGENYSGTAYLWDIPQKDPYNASLFQRGSGEGNESFRITYNVSGEGDYRVQQLYIVGLDPRQVDGAFASPLITIIVGLQTYSKEILYLGVVLFLIVLNITNLVVSSRINKQVDKRLPHNYHEYQKLKEEIERLKEHVK